KVVETNTEHCEGYHAMVTLTVTTEKQTRTVSGTVFGDGSARVISLNGIPIEAPFVEHMLYTVNDDKPGYIGALGMLLGDAAVNIASFHLGRQSEGGDAIALIAMDQALPEAVMEKVRALPHVRQAADLSFG
ncbi:MAG: ACT domain-containing protein, partial [Rhodospirillaceae bacterium]